MDRQEVLYHPDKVLVQASNVPGLIPVRLFARLYPLWLVEIDAHEEAKRPYALIERFIERGIQEAQLRTIEEMVDFFGLSTSLVTKVLHFLAAIEHVQYAEGGWSLTARGEQSLSQSVKSVRQEKGQYLYFDGFCSRPLLQDHYDKQLHIISDLEAETVTRTPMGGYRFYRFYASEMWNSQALNDLVNSSDRALYNLPYELRAIKAMNYARVYMPMYVVETKKPPLMLPYYLAYTHIKGQRDLFFERLINDTLSIQRALDATPREENLAEIWSKWLRSKNLAYLQPKLTHQGLWRVALPETFFQSSEYPLRKIGSYYKEKGYFLQLWCNSDGIRRQAAFDHALYVVQKKYRTLHQEYVEDILRRWCEQLEVTSASIHELHSWMKEQKVEKEVLQKLAAWCEKATP